MTIPFPQTFWCKFSSAGMASLTPAKRFRSSSVPVNETRLRRALSPYAKIKKCVWRWGANHYGKPLRGTGLDRDTLSDSSPVLSALADQAPNGYPATAGIRNVLIALDKDHKILENKTDTCDQYTAAQFAADRWKKMMRMYWT